MSWIRPVEGGVRVNVRVQPRASRDEVVGVMGDALKIRLQAPPLEGRANAALLRFLAKTLDVSRGSVTIEAGAKGRNKAVLVKAVSESDARARLGL